MERKKKCGYCTWHSIISLQVFNDIAFCYSVFFILQVFDEIAFCYFSVFLLILQVFNDIAFCYFLFFFILQVLMI